MMSNRAKSETERRKVEQEKLQCVLLGLLREEENRYCADCDAKGPRWASWNLGVFLCIRCAGIHRNLGVHVSKVKSVNLDSWTVEQVQSMRLLGNSVAKAAYEGRLPEQFRRPQTDQALDQFIRAKYEQRRYLMRDWIAPVVRASDLRLDDVSRSASAGANDPATAGGRAKQSSKAAAAAAAAGKSTAAATKVARKPAQQTAPVAPSSAPANKPKSAMDDLFSLQPAAAQPAQQQPLQPSPSAAAGVDDLLSLNGVGGGDGGGGVLASLSFGPLQSATTGGPSPQSLGGDPAAQTTAAAGFPHVASEPNLLAATTDPRKSNADILALYGSSNSLGLQQHGPPPHYQNQPAHHHKPGYGAAPPPAAGFGGFGAPTQMRPAYHHPSAAPGHVGFPGAQQHFGMQQQPQPYTAEQLQALQAQMNGLAMQQGQQARSTMATSLWQ